jgi:hypothetical protein
LITGVLSRIEKRRRRWWQREWLSWPLAPKVFSIAGTFALLAGCVLGLTWLPHLFASEAPLITASGLLSRLSEFFAPITTLGKAAFIVLRPLAHPWIVTGFAVLCFGMYLTCVALGTACVRLAWAHPRTR